MKIICLGRNYVAHANELSSPVPEEPVFFLKPDTSLLLHDRPFYYPDFSKEIHYEVEIVFKLCKTGKNIRVESASSYYDTIGIGLDLTARDLQQVCKAKGLPWTIAKGFDHAAPLSPFINKNDLADIHAIDFHLDVNGRTVQHGNTKNMIFGIDRLIAYLSMFMTLKKGDLIFTGTPEGVGPVKVGDRIEAFIGEKKMLECGIR